ncbi:MAG: hypothetical protein CFH06_01532, partial [Alphaproteobacteria bacterium MarineAlpha3_Bin5]
MPESHGSRNKRKRVSWEKVKYGYFFA